MASNLTETGEVDDVTVCDDIPNLLGRASNLKDEKEVDHSTRRNTALKFVTSVGKGAMGRLNKFLEQRPERLDDDPHLNSSDEVECASEALEECPSQTNPYVFRPEATVVDEMNYLKLGQMLKFLNMKVTSDKEDRHRLKQRLFSGERISSFSQEIKDQLNKTVQKYKGLKKNLLEHYSDIIATVQNESFKENMNAVAERRFPCYEVELQSIRTMLEKMTDEFEIVVSGETSSGKSTFLNVLLGENILPSHHLHTTASLCRLRNSENRRIECIAGNRIVDNIPLEADSNKLREKLESIMQELHEKDEPLKTFDVYWPISSLNENVVFVDTPGIGERDVLTEQVVEYVPKSAGYIFIIDSSHAGGVQDSGIRPLIEAIAVSASKEVHAWDLSNTIFVCNKWDQVKNKHRKKVLEDTNNKIRKYFKKLEDWQIVLFNADLELKLLKWKANPTDDFKMLLKSLETMMIRTIDNRLGDKKRFLHNFVTDVSGLVNARVTTAKLSKENAQTELTKAREELKLATNALKQASTIEATVGDEAKLLLQALQEYLKSEDVERKLFDWTKCAPELSKVATDGPALIQARLQDTLLEWTTKETGQFNQASVRITRMCRDMQDEIDLRISNLNKFELGFTLRKSSDQNSGIGSVTSLISYHIWGIAVMVFRAIRVMSLLNWAREKLKSASKRMSIEEMTRLTKEVMSNFFSTNGDQSFITDSFTSLHSEWFTKLKKDSLCTIDSVLETIKQMDQDLDVSKDTLTMFEPLQTKLNEHSKCLKELEIPYLDPFPCHA